MDKGLIVSYLLEIVVATFIIFASQVYWDKINLSQYQTVAQSYESYNSNLIVANK
jgi:hypothetical protein